MHGRTDTSIDVKAFCSPWPEGLGVIICLGKSEENLWCELRPMLGQARVKDGWWAAGVGEARRAVILAPGHPHTMLSFRRSSSNSSSPLPPTSKAQDHYNECHRSQEEDKELTYSQPSAHLHEGRKQRGHSSGSSLESQTSCGSFSLLAGQESRVAWPKALACVESRGPVAWGKGWKWRQWGSSSPASLGNELKIR